MRFAILPWYAWGLLGLITTLLLATTEEPIGVASAAPENANILKFKCDYYDTQVVDPLNPSADHLHDLYGERPLTDSTTSSELGASTNTTCLGFPDHHRAYWTPAIKDSTGALQVPDRTVPYYEDNNADDPDMHLVPDGAGMIGGVSATKVVWRCASGPALTAPPASCKSSFRIEIFFQNCWDGVGLVGNEHYTFVDNQQVLTCPADYPVRLPDVRIVNHYKNRAGREVFPIEVSMGSGMYGDWHSFHGDLFGEDGPEFERIQRECFLDKPQSSPTPEICTKFG